MRNESGYAVMEAFLVGLVLMVPLTWLLLAASSLHRTALTSSSAVREAGLAASRSVSASDAHRQARTAIVRVLSERGIDPSNSEVSLSRVGGRDSTFRVHLQVPVPVLAVPFVGRPVGPVIWVKARYVGRGDPYRSLDE